MNQKTLNEWAADETVGPHLRARVRSLIGQVQLLQAMLKLVADKAETVTPLLSKEEIAVLRQRSV